jgi:hypothetical protein
MLGLSPQSCGILLFAIDVGDEVVDALAPNEDADVIVVDRSREYLTQVAIYLLCSLGAEGLVGKVGIGVDGERTLLGVEVEAKEPTVVHLHLF